MDQLDSDINDPFDNIDNINDDIVYEVSTEYTSYIVYIIVAIIIIFLLIWGILTIFSPDDAVIILNEMQNVNTNLNPISDL